ncbi:fructokinase [Clostridium acetobutylicum]|uniref:Fructokinase n=2 Tax=Clostridium acetobutylicum TaxID=1488 RepID=Q7D468_CLOAB|nr:MULTISPECIES: carbohydrate kinase [Clostridium]AAF35840.1 ScrK [Clostridium acetobutylicum ATCC 824]AAK78404.1 Fructokinase [Clostridium acetobutylicum ATCC 824]ADZ19474.1 Fructokinase [Clostridium acetobutylicum EA 2018]AEI34015.1 fructokinase [Clostridium acetobutylicum DSM 1731]AWV80127.1 carbohydrate kinase [Clostridium acetobutylicum]
MNNVLCIGELLIDFICSDIDTTLSKGENFKKKAGGAPANVTAAISKLGGSASFLGKVGNDPFGHFLKETLDEVKVDTSMLIMDNNSSTTLAFVSLQANGERDFVFNRGADGLLRYDEINLDKVYSNKIIHFGSATALLGGEMTDTYLKIMEEAKKRGIIISFDPNYRDNLWENRTEEFIAISRKCIELADFVKLSDEELKIISGEKNIKNGVKLLASNNKVIAVTLGKEGTMISNGEEVEIIESIKIKSIDSTGAGDAFVGAFLYKLSEALEARDILSDFNKIKENVRFANKVGAIVCTKLGAISSLPSLSEVEGD